MLPMSPGDKTYYCEDKYDTYNQERCYESATVFYDMTTFFFVTNKRIVIYVFADNIVILVSHLCANHRGVFFTGKASVLASLDNLSHTNQYGACPYC